MHGIGLFCCLFCFVTFTSRLLADLCYSLHHTLQGCLIVTGATGQSYCPGPIINKITPYVTEVILSDTGKLERLQATIRYKNTGILIMLHLLLHQLIEPIFYVTESCSWLCHWIFSAYCHVFKLAWVYIDQYPSNLKNELDRLSPGGSRTLSTEPPHRRINISHYNCNGIIAVTPFIYNTTPSAVGFFFGDKSTPAG